MDQWFRVLSAQPHGTPASTAIGMWFAIDTAKAAHQDKAFEVRNSIFNIKSLHSNEQIIIAFPDSILPVRPDR